MRRALSLAFALTLCLALTAPARANNTGTAGEYNTVSCGGSCSAVIDTNGSLWAWGFNKNGILGFEGGDLKSVWGPCQSTPVKAMDHVASVSFGGQQAVVKTDGSLWMWGNNSYGTLGNGTTEYRSTPQKVMDNVTAVVCGQYDTAVIKTDGTLWMWGNNDNGQLGSYWNGSIDSHYWQTTPVKLLDDVVAVSCGYGFVAAIKTDGSLWMWGENYYGQLGIGTEGEKADRSTPVKVMDKVTAVSCGLSHTAVVDENGCLWTWGRNYQGQLGDGSTVDRSTPVKVLDHVAAVNCGAAHSAAIKTDGSLWTWGRNDGGQLGFAGGNESYIYNSYYFEDHYLCDSRACQTIPVNVLNQVAAISCSDYYTAAVKTDGSLWMWGLNACGQLGCADGNGKYEGSPYDASPIQTTPRQVSGLTVRVPAAKPGKSGFIDVADSAYCADAVVWAVKNGITNGTSSTTFSPDDTCTTAQILTFLHRAKGSPAPMQDNPYSDVKSSDYFYNAALWACENGLTDGDSFNGGTPCTRAAVVTYLWKLAGKPSAGSTAFSDVPASADYAQAVAWAVAQGITNGTGDTTFSPDATCTRGQIVTFLYRAYGK